MAAIATDTRGLLEVARLEDLKREGRLVVQGPDRKIALFYDQGQVFAVDNRCPHLGFPLAKGTLQDGILVCHWHHARFDVASGCAFDLWADDVPAYPVEVRDGRVYVSFAGRGSSAQQLLTRLRQGMEHNLGLVICKTIPALLRAGVDYREIVREAALFGTRYRDGWGPGLTILVAMANLVPRLPESVAVLALSQGVTRTASDCAGQVPRRDRYPLAGREGEAAAYRRLLRHWTLSRHRDGAERTLLTALSDSADPAAVSEMLFAALTDRFYADTGHPLDFANKAFELCEIIGWEHAPQVLPSLTSGLVMARGAEESSPWRYPIDLVPLLEGAFERLEGNLEAGRGQEWHGEVVLADALLGDEPSAIVAALEEALRSGARPEQLGRSLAYAAALRIARFGTANEFSDWDTALHTFTFCNAVCQALKRGPSPDVLRGVFHGAMSIYQDRFLNVPPARLPEELSSAPPQPAPSEELLRELLDSLNSQQHVGRAAALVSRYLRLGHPEEPLIAALTEATVREDAAFHTFQMLEAGVRQYDEWRGTPQAGHILVAVARYLAAHSPTQRAFLQTAQIARKLQRGEDLYEEAAEAGSNGS